MKDSKANPIPQLPQPMRGNEPGSFAEDTLSRRLPGIARSLLDEPWHPLARTRLQALVDDMPAGHLRPIQDPGAPDYDELAYRSAALPGTDLAGGALVRSRALFLPPHPGGDRLFPARRGSRSRSLPLAKDHRLNRGDRTARTGARPAGASLNRPATNRFRIRCGACSIPWCGATGPT